MYFGRKIGQIILPHLVLNQEYKIYLGIEAMLLETVSSKAKNEKQFSNMITMTLKAILANDRYPMSLYTSTVLRVRSEQGKVTSGRAAIIKAVLIKNYKIFDLDLFVYLLCLSIYFSQDFQIPSLTHHYYLVVD